MNDIIEEATPIIFSQNSLNPCLAHFGVDDFNEDGYIIEVNDQVVRPILKSSHLGSKNMSHHLAPQ